MGSAVQCFTVFLLHLLISSGSSMAEKSPLEATPEYMKPNDHVNRILLSPSFTVTGFDTSGNIPIVIPTTPSTTTPVLNPPYSPTPPTEPLQAPPTPTIAPIIPITPTTPKVTPTIPTTPTTPTAPVITPSSSGGQWCIASPTASETVLQVALDYACGYGGADCSAIQQGGSCYSPTTVRDHASYAFNAYNRKNPSPTSFVFGGAAQLSSTDPSKGSCRFQAASSSTSPSPPSPVISTPTTTAPTTTTPTITIPPSTITPTTIPIPGGPTGYGGGPAGLPSSATCLSSSLLTLFIAAGLVGPLLAANELQVGGY